MTTPLRTLLLPLALLLLAACATASVRPGPQPAPAPTEPASASRPAEPLRLTLVGTNDLHGWVAPHRTVLPGGAVVEQGGLATFAGYLAALRKEAPGSVLLLDGGDMFQGTLASNLSEGAVVIQAMNALGYAAAALGNHEFDFGPVGPVSVAREAEGMDPFGALKARMAEARFPVLAANLYSAANGARPGWLGNDGTLLVERNGVRVGILGLATPSTPQTTHPVNVASLRFGSLAPAALEAAGRLRARGAEVVVAVVHAGGACTRFDAPEDTSSCDRNNGELFDFLEELPEGTLDAVVAGHTHQRVGHFIRGTPVIESGGLGRSFGLIELFVDPHTRRVLPARTRITSGIEVCASVEASSGSCDARVLGRLERLSLVPVTFRGQQVLPDAGIEALIAPALKLVAQVQQRPLGLLAPQGLARAYEEESALGSLVADALREVSGADVALFNSGGLRADLRAGELRYGDVYEVLPFDNTLAIVTLTGADLERLLQAAYGARMGVFQVSGLEVRLRPCPGLARLESVTLPGGRPLPAARRFRVAMPDFLARGGDGLESVLRSLPPGSVDFGGGPEALLRDLLVEHWQKGGQPLVAPRPGRIRIRPGREACPTSASTRP